MGGRQRPELWTTLQCHWVTDNLRKDGVICIDTHNTTTQFFSAQETTWIDHVWREEAAISIERIREEGAGPLWIQNGHTKPEVGRPGPIVARGGVFSHRKS